MLAKPETGWSLLALTRRAVPGFFVVAMASGLGIAGQEGAPQDIYREGDLANVDLEGLMAIPVTSVAMPIKRTESRYGSWTDDQD